MSTEESLLQQKIKHPTHFFFKLVLVKINVKDQNWKKTYKKFETKYSLTIGNVCNNNNKQEKKKK